MGLPLMESRGAGIHNNQMIRVCGGTFFARKFYNNDGDNDGMTMMG